MTKDHHSQGSRRENICSLKPSDVTFWKHKHITRENKYFPQELLGCADPLLSLWKHFLIQQANLFFLGVCDLISLTPYSGWPSGCREVLIWESQDYFKT